MINQFVKLFRTNSKETLEEQINNYLLHNRNLKVIQVTFASDCKLYGPEALILFERVESIQESKSSDAKLTTDARTKVINKIATFFEKSSNWTRLKDCYLVGDRSDDLRELLVEALRNE